ncbi:MAG: barstar family protein [Clostridium sp.]|nr:barstar family protein [Clostridium sp.]
MRTCILNGDELTSREILHNTLADSLGFPDWYGKNLDALYDCLTDLHEEVEIMLLHENTLAEHLGNYAPLLAKVIREAAENNPLIHFSGN